MEKIENLLMFIFYFIYKGSWKKYYNAWHYMRKYSILPRLMGFVQIPSLKYKLSLLYVYIKYYYYSYDKGHSYILNCIPRVFCTYYLSHKTHHFDSGHSVINKIESYRIFLKNGLPIPKTIGITDGGNVYDLNNEVVNIDNLPDNYELFCKKISLSCGSGSKIIKPENINKLGDGYIIQENMKNGEFIRMLTNDRSNMLNSIRVHVYRSLKTQKVIFLASYLKLGLKERITDNYGLSIPINNETGKLSKYGVEFGFSEDRLKPKYEVSAYDKNSPLFEGQHIPNWNEIRKVVINASNLIGTLFIGFDIALTDKGIVILECNSIGDIFIFQAFDSGIYNTPLISENIASTSEHIWIKKYEKKYSKILKK